jgi:hypothetical protein
MDFLKWFNFDQKTEDPTPSPSPEEGALIIDHNFATLGALKAVPVEWINKARSDLKIYYNHTSHGSQIITGMDGLPAFMSGAHGYAGSAFSFNMDGSGGALRIWDAASADLGNAEWPAITRNFIEANPSVNVVMWSWCGQVSWMSEQEISGYLTSMSSLETEYPDIKFVYMTGHTDGSGEEGTLNLRNEQIRKYCIDNDKILYDFADIESYDPDGNYYLDLSCNDNCDYQSGGVTRNWATDWQAAHTENTDWYNCSAAHSQALNGNRKAYAAWYLFARLAGYEG